MLLIDKMMEEYAAKFGDGFPSYQIMRSRTEEETIEIIKDCLEQDKDAYELGYVSDEEEIEY